MSIIIEKSPLLKKEEDVIKLYNEMAGRQIKFLPREKRVSDALKVFSLDDYKRVFQWAQDDEWCKANDIFKTRVGWICSFNVMAEHSDYERPAEKAKEGGSWTLTNLNSTKKNHTSIKP